MVEAEIREINENRSSILNDLSDDCLADPNFVEIHDFNYGIFVGADIVGYSSANRISCQGHLSYSFIEPEMRGDLSIKGKSAYRAVTERRIDDLESNSIHVYTNATTENPKVQSLMEDLDFHTVGIQPGENGRTNNKMVKPRKEAEISERFMDLPILREVAEIHNLDTEIMQETPEITGYAFEDGHKENSYSLERGEDQLELPEGAEEILVDAEDPYFLPAAQQLTDKGYFTSEIRDLYNSSKSTNLVFKPKPEFTEETYLTHEARRYISAAGIDYEELEEENKVRIKP